MGAVHRDMSASSRQYETDYPGLHTVPGVKALLRDYTKLRRNAYDKGDYDALVLAADLETAVARAGLTGKQAQVLRMVYIEGLTQQEAADELATSQQYVDKTITISAKKLAKIYADWWEKDGEY